MIEVTFNGVRLSEYIRVTDVIRPIGNNREVTLSENLSIGATVTFQSTHPRRVRRPLIWDNNHVYLFQSTHPRRVRLCI